MIDSDDYILQKNNLVRLPKGILADIIIQNSVLILQLFEDNEGLKDMISVQGRRKDDVLH